jgi:hypothetical protein
MRVRFRPSVLFAAALVSAGLFVLVVVDWVLSYSRPWASGWHEVQEATPTTFVNDSYTVQGNRGRFWFGRCRVTVIGWRDFPEGFTEELARLTHKLGVFEFDGQPSPVRGVGWISGEVTVDLPLVSRLSYQVDGLLLPAWSLALVCAILPTLWVWRRLRHRPAAPADQGDEPRSW